MESFPKPHFQEKPFNYSSEFHELTDSPKKLKRLLERSCVSYESTDSDYDRLQTWEEERAFIAQAIKKDGAILDHGCANGFLLRSLQEWSEFKLDPYGIDVEEGAIEAARKLFSECPDHFASSSDETESFPERFDHIYWNVWDNWTFEKGEELDLYDDLHEKVADGGRLILGFYDTKDKNLERIERLIQSGINTSGVLENPSGREQVIVWIDKK